MTIMLPVQADRLLEEWNLDLQVYGVTDSRWMLLSATPIDLSTWQSVLDKQVQPKLVPLSIFLTDSAPSNNLPYNIASDHLVIVLYRRLRQIWTPLPTTLPASSIPPTRSSSTAQPAQRCLASIQSKRSA